jgi:hypothetical protein
MCIHTYIYIHIYTYIYTHKYVNIYMYENINIHIYNYIYTSLSEKVLDLFPLSRADINTDSLSPGVDFLFTVSMLSLLNSSMNSSG